MKCLAPECEADAKRRGLCVKHYTRFRRHGDFSVRKAPNGEAREWLLDHLSHVGSECLIWPYFRDKTGYAMVRWEGRCQVASRVICRLVHGEPPTSKHEAAHSCGNGAGGCIHPSHLHWATPKENNQEKILHGTSRRGVLSPVSKLTEDQVRTIRHLRGRVSQRKLAARFGVSQGAVSLIHLGRNWGWLR